MTTSARLMGLVWLRPDDEALQSVCADALAEDHGWDYDVALSHARYHARRSRAYYGEHTAERDALAAEMGYDLPS